MVTVGLTKEAVTPTTVTGAPEGWRAQALRRLTGDRVASTSGYYLGLQGKPTGTQQGVPALA